MRRLILPVLALCLLTPVFAATDTDGDGISDLIETELGLLPQVKQEFVLISESPNQGFTAAQATQNAPDILRFEAAHVGDNRVVFKVTFAHPVDFNGSTFIIYADLDGKPETGRADQYHGGTETMFAFSDRMMSLTMYPPSRENNTGARHAKDGNVLYVAVDFPFRRENGKVLLGAHLLSQRTEGKSDSTAQVMVQLPVSTATVPKLPLGTQGMSRALTDFRYYNDRVAYEKLEDKGLKAEQVTPKTPIVPGRERPEVKYASQGRQPGKAGNVDVRRVPVELLEEAGVARQAAVLSFGVPLPQGAVYSLDRIKLVDGSKEVPAQFAATAFWPDDSVKWVLVDATMALKAGERRGLEVVFGNKVSRAKQEGGLVVNRPGKEITVSPMSAMPSGGNELRSLLCRINTERFNLISQVWRGAALGGWVSSEKNPIVTGEPAGVTIVDEQGKKYSMGLGAPEEVVVEQQGPQKVVVRARGPYTAEDGSTYMRYLARLTFRASSPLVEVAVTTINDYLKTEFTDFGSVSLGLKANSALQGVTVYGEDGGKPKPVAGTAAVQLDETKMASGPGKGAGVVTWNGGGAVLHDFWQRWPKGISATGDQLTFDLLPAQPSADYGKDLPFYLMFPFVDGKYRLKWGMSFTERISFDFSGTMTPEELWAEAQKPVVPVIPAAWYAETKAMGTIAVPLGKQFAQWDKYVADAYKGYMEGKQRDREYGFLNYGDWFGERGRNWGNNEYDLAHGFFAQFARTGDRDLFRWAQIAAQHRADVETVWAYPDPYYVGANPQHSIGHTGMWTQDVERALWTYRYDSHVDATGGHNWTDGLMDCWYLTGEPRCMESGLAFGEHVAWAMAPAFKELGTHERSAGWSLRSIMAIYKATHDPVYLEAAKKIAYVAVNAQGPEGNWPHVLPKDHAGDSPGAIGNNLFLIGILLGGLQAYHEETQDPAVLKTLENGALWVARSWDEKAAGWPYSAKTDGTPVYRPSTGLNQLIIGPLAYVGRLTNNEKLLHIASEGMAATASQSPSGNGKSIAQQFFFTPQVLAELQQWYAKTMPDKGATVLDGTPEAMAAMLIRTATSERHNVRAPNVKVFFVRLKRDIAELTLQRTPHGAMIKVADQATLKALDASGKVVQQATCSTDEKAEIKWTLVGKGAQVFKIVIDDDQRGVWTLSGADLDIVAKTVEGFRIGGVGRSRYYFTVPQGTAEFSLKLLGAHTGGYGAVVLDPQGKLVGTFQGTNTGGALIPGAAGGTAAAGHPELGTLTVKPDAAQTGKVWSVILTAAGDIGVELVGVPPYLALSAEDWFQGE
ncbi:MAG: hypothetical protein ABFE08_03160 [Armatimonadia bacterium]